MFKTTNQQSMAQGLQAQFRCFGTSDFGKASMRPRIRVDESVVDDGQLMVNQWFWLTNGE